MGNYLQELASGGDLIAKMHENLALSVDCGYFAISVLGYTCSGKRTMGFAIGSRDNFGKPWGYEYRFRPFGFWRT